MYPLSFVTMLGEVSFGITYVFQKFYQARASYK